MALGLTARFRANQKSASDELGGPQKSNKRNIALRARCNFSVVVYPDPARLLHDTAGTRRNLAAFTRSQEELC